MRWPRSPSGLARTCGGWGTGEQWDMRAGRLEQGQNARSDVRVGSSCAGGGRHVALSQRARGYTAYAADAAGVVQHECARVAAGDALPFSLSTLREERVARVRSRCDWRRAPVPLHFEGRARCTRALELRLAARSWWPSRRSKAPPRFALPHVEGCVVGLAPMRTDACTCHHDAPASLSTSRGWSAVTRGARADAPEAAGLVTGAVLEHSSHNVAKGAQAVQDGSINAANGSHLGVGAERVAVATGRGRGTGRVCRGLGTALTAPSADAVDEEAHAVEGQRFRRRPWGRLRAPRDRPCPCPTAPRGSARRAAAPWGRARTSSARRGSGRASAC